MYAPTEVEKKQATLVQGLAVPFFFIPAWIAIRSRLGRQSLYCHYWAKVNLIWSVLAVMLIAGLLVVGCYAPVCGVLVVVVLLHVVVCVMGAFSASQNLPFGYLFVAPWFCPRDRLALVRPLGAAADAVNKPHEGRLSGV